MEENGVGYRRERRGEPQSGNKKREANGRADAAAVKGAKDHEMPFELVKKKASNVKLTKQIQKVLIETFKLRCQMKEGWRRDRGQE